MREPKLIVFDLDFTLWDCGGLWIDCTTPPFRLDDSSQVRDDAGRKFRLYPDIADILDSVDCPLALASRTEQPSWATDVLDLMQIRDRFDFEEIFPSSKIAHFKNLRDASGIAFSDMLFFDDEHRNIAEVGLLGVTAIKVGRGVDWMTFQRGLEYFAAG